MNLKLLPLKKPVKVAITVPGSKSYTNRALLLASLTKGEVELVNPLLSDDTQAMISCLKTLGIKITLKEKSLIVAGNINNIQNKIFTLDANLSATTIRFLLALCTIIPGIKILNGKPELLRRPIGDLVDALRGMGAKIEYLGKKGFPPVKVLSNNLAAKKIHLKGNMSSQFLSALLMILPKTDATEVEVSNLVSKSYIDLTLSVMEQFGVLITNKQYKLFSLRNQQEYNASRINIEGDISSATYFAAIAALTKSTVTLKNINVHSKQGDMKFFDILASMGNKVVKKQNSITVIGSNVKPVNIDMNDCPDSIQTLAVLTSFTKGKTNIKGIETLRVKETDRVAALQSELGKMKIRVNTTKDVLTVFGGLPEPSEITTYNDHRMAMAFAVAGAKLEGMVIDHAEVVSKTFPHFWEEIEKIGIITEKILPSKIVLIGFMGTGKSSVAPLLAKKLQKEVVEMDDFVIKRSSRSSVGEIFKKDGEKKFRELEDQVAEKLKDQKNIIISTGGGVVTNNALMQNLTHDSFVVFLNTTLDTIKKRLIDIKNRPLWKDIRETEKLYGNRLPLYKKYADITVQTDGKSLGTVTQEVLSKIEGE